MRINGKPQGPGCTDWALLKLSADQTSCDGLLTHSGLFHHSSEICIIGYLDDSVKKKLIVSQETAVKLWRGTAEVIKIVFILLQTFFEDVAEDV